MQSFYTIQKHEESVVYMERKIKRTKKKLTSTIQRTTLLPPLIKIGLKHLKSIDIVHQLEAFHPTQREVLKTIILGFFFSFLLQLTATFSMGKCENFHYIITFCLIIVQDAKDKLSYIDKITFIVFF